MKILKFKEPDGGRHQYQTEDIQRIVNVCFENGYYLSKDQAMVAWEKYSEDFYAAGWLIIPEKDEDILKCILCVMETEE